jgi:uncharacterized membrane protein
MHESLHKPTFRLNSILFGGFIVLAFALWFDMPDRYPIRFDISGNPVAWQDKNPATWVLIVMFCTITFGKMHLFQRFLINDPDSDLLNIPKKKLFRQLPHERKIEVLRRVNRITGIMNTMVLATFTAILLAIWSWAHNQVITLPWALSLGLVLLVILAYAVYEAVMLNRIISRKLREEGLLS